MKRDDKRAPDPFSQALMVVVLFAALYMAIEALVFQIAIVSLIPPSATFTLPSGGPDPQAGGGESATHYTK